MNKNEQIALLHLLQQRNYSHNLSSLRQALSEGSSANDLRTKANISDYDLQNACLTAEKWITNGFQVTSWFDHDYPKQLKDVYDFPYYYFLKESCMKTIWEYAL